MSWYSDRAGALQRASKSDEIERKFNIEYDETDVNQAIVHMRQDIVLLYSLLDSLNGQVRTIKWFVGIGVSFYIFNLPFWQNI